MIHKCITDEGVVLEILAERPDIRAEIEETLASKKALATGQAVAVFYPCGEDVTGVQFLYALFEGFDDPNENGWVLMVFMPESNSADEFAKARRAAELTLEMIQERYRRTLS